MSRNAKYSILGATILGCLVAFGVFVWGEAVDQKVEATLANVKQVQNGKGATDGKNVPAPNLDRPVVVTATLTPSAKETNLERIAELINRLKKEPVLIDWLELGVYLKAIGDLDGAEEIWRYAAANSSDGIAFANLANLYMYNRKDYKKGEEFLLAAIASAPHQVLYYETAYELYHFILKNDAKGKQVIMKGLLANPEFADAFKDILARF